MNPEPLNSERLNIEPWTLAGLHSAVQFTLTVDVEPGLLPRLLQPFAKRDLVPDRFESRRSDAFMRVDIAMAAMPAEMVHLVAGNLRQTVGVRSVAMQQEITGSVRRRAA
jgi:hypothetical protein